jgi:hypothetical protein
VYVVPLLIAIPLLAVVQSVFGVGLLLFGTPLLLLFGYPYTELLYILLPASLTLSLLQIRFDHAVRLREAAGFAIWTVWAIAAGMGMSLLVLHNVDIRLPVAALLAATGLLRMSARARLALRRLCARLGRPALAGIALIHGMTNMGGGLLAAYAGARSEVKNEMHRTISIVYALFAGSQLVVLCILHGPPALDLRLLSSTCGVALAYLLLGRRVYRGVSDSRYQICFSTFMLGCASVLCWQAAQ